MAFFTPEELNTIRSAGLPDLARPQVPVKKKGFWQDQISTGGGIAGSLGGAAAGGAIGAAFGGVGAVPGALIGAILGGFGGGAGGQAVENAVVGDDLGKDVLKEGALNALFSVGPVRGANIALKGGEALLRGAGGAGIRDAVTQAATATPIRNAIFGQAGSKLEQAGQKLLGSQANLTRAEARKLGQGGAPADVIGGINKSLGLSSIDDMAAVGGNVTGSNGVLSELTRNAVGNSPGVDFGNLRNVASDLLTNQAPLVSNATRKNVLDQVQNSVVKAYGGSKGSLSTLANPLDAFDVAKSFEKMAAKIRTSPTVSPADEQLAGVYSNLAKHMTDQLFSAPGVSEGVQMARKEAADKFMQLANSATSKAQKEAYTKLANETMNMADVQSIRSAQAPFVKLGKIEEKTRLAQSGAGAQFGDQMQGLGKLVQKPTNLLAMPLNAATPRVGGLMTKAGAKISSTQGTVNPLMQALATVGRIGAGDNLINSLTTPQDAQSQVQQAPQVDMNTLSDQSQLDPTMTAQDNSNPFGISQAEIAQNMMLALQRGDSKGFSQLKDLYDMVTASQSSGSKMNSASARAMAQSANGENTINQLEQLLNQAGGGSGYIGGSVEGFLGNAGFNNNAKTYNDLAAGSIAQIAKALGETGSLSDSDIKTYGAMLPKLTDTPEVARRKIAALRERLMTAKQNMALYGSGDATSLQDALYGN